MRKFDKIYKEVEKITREKKLMEKRYGIDSIPSNEPIFTTSQETDVKEYIYDGMDVDEIIEIIKQW